MDFSHVLGVVNKDPISILHQAATSSYFFIEIDGLRVKIALNRIKGCIVVFAPNGSFYLFWDKKNNKWYPKSR